MRRLRRATASVRVRVALATGATFAVVLVVAAVWLLHALESHLTSEARQQAETAVQTEAQRIAVAGSTTVGAGGLSGGPVTSRDGVLVITYRTPPGMASTTPIDSVRTFDVTTDDVTVPVDPRTATALGLATGGPYILATMPLDEQVSIAAVSSLADARNTIDSTRALLWWVVPGLVLLVAGLAWLIVGRALRPVHAVTNRVAAIGGDSLHERVPVPASADEVSELATTMNAMLDRLESATVASRQLVSDASHELRTPIAVMRTELEVARREAGTDWCAVSAGLLGEVDRLQGLVDDLLLLARTSERGVQTEPVDVADVVREVAARRWRVPVAVRGADSPAVAEVDRAALHRALDHLVANAARHAASRVEVTVDGTSIHVDDDGTGIPAEQRARVVERFVRLDEARARDAGGSGLGLAVAADVARAHGGSLAITDSPLGGARVSLALSSPGAIARR